MRKTKTRLDPPSRFTFSNGNMRCRVCGWVYRNVPQNEREGRARHHLFTISKDACRPAIRQC